MGEMDQLPAAVDRGDRAEEDADERGERTLPAQQQSALEMLVGGKSVAESARLLGVDRSTIFRWLKNDPVFRAAYNQWQDQVRSSCQSRLLTMTDKAANAIEKTLEAGDARTAMQLLKGMGMIKERETGPTEAAEVRERIDMEREERRIALKRDWSRLLGADFDAAAGW